MSITDRALIATSPSAKTIDGPFLKWLVIASGLVPGVLLVWDALHGQLGVNHVNFAIHTTGLVGLVLLTLSLVITPLRELTGWNTVIATRRNFGVLSFAYLAAHFIIFFWWDRQHSVTSTLTEIVMRKYLWFGTAALVLMTPLAITSTDAMISRLGAVKWKALHRLAYLIIIGGVIHYYMLVKSDTRQPIAFAIAATVLLSYRVVSHYVGLRAEVRKARTKTTAVAAKQKKFWSGELEIARIFDETHDVKTFRLVSPDGGPLPFTHTAGQYLTLALTIDGKRVNRSYTIASSPTRSAYCEISVKHVPNGYGSKHLHETWREGQRVKVSAPAGRFVFAGNETDRVLLIAGGIGITPMMSVVRSLTDQGWRGEVSLLFSVRAVRDVVFRTELDYLLARFPNLRAEILVSQDLDTPWNGARGNITRDVIAAFMPNLNRVRVLLCGPPPMMDAMRAHLVALGVPDADVHQEKFVSPPASSPTDDIGAIADANAGEGLGEGDTAQISFKRAGVTADINSDQTVLEAAEDAGIDIPYECRSGICGQCKTPLISGRVTMEVQDALTSADRAKGIILACQARPVQNVEVDA